MNSWASWKSRQRRNQFAPGRPRRCAFHYRPQKLRVCKKKIWSACDNTNPNAHLMEAAYGYSGSGLFGYSHMTGGYVGGQAQYVHNYMQPLLERIEEPQIVPSYIVSHRITLDEAPDMYRVWRDKKQNVTKNRDRPLGRDRHPHFRKRLNATFSARVV
jgi:threonine dehydrogenase-like Zn-dependent dehydrogenase